jgi:hypothetical protein
VADVRQELILQTLRLAGAEALRSNGVLGAQLLQLAPFLPAARPRALAAASWSAMSMSR